MNHRLVIVCVLLVASFLAGWYLGGRNDTVATGPELADALPRWSFGACVPATPAEQQRFEAAVATLDTFGADINALRIGARKFLAHGIYREVDGRATAACPPAGLYARVGEIMARHRMWRIGRVVEYDLTLAARIGQARPEIVAAVAAVAFNDQRQRSERSPERDIRPMARTVLASLGRGAATSFGETAYAQMSVDDALGTGAAQVAAAAGHPDALPRIAELMGDQLASVAADDAIPRDTRNRLYELAHAIAFAGDPARQYVGPIRQLMGRKVQSAAPPFGMVALSPKRMCAVLARIDGNAAAQLTEFTYCTDDAVPYER